MKVKLFFIFLLSTVILSFPLKANDNLSIESEAIEIAEHIRCLACADENIESKANAFNGTAKDLRHFIRKHLQDGNSAEFVTNLVVSQYSDIVSGEEVQDSKIWPEILFAILTALLIFSLMGIYLLKNKKAMGNKE